MKASQYYAASAVLLFGSGLGLGVLLGRLLASRAFDARLDGEVAAIKDHYQARAASARDASHADKPEAAVGTSRSRHEAAGGEHDGALEGLSPEGDEPSGRDEATGVEHDPSWPPVNRVTTKPYTISYHEFCDDNQYNKITITWYDLDKVLVDDREEPIPDVLRTTGPMGLHRFGGPSNDPNICYVRNEKLEADFEIVLNRNAYVAAVLNYGSPNDTSKGG